MEHDIRYIKGLLDKFMEGKTSLEEERVLEDFFASGAEIPSEWEDYRSMFSYFASGMKGEPAGSAPARRESGRRIFFPVWVRTLAAACFIGLVLAAGFAVRDRGESTEAVAEAGGVEENRRPTESKSASGAAGTAIPEAGCDETARRGTVAASGAAAPVRVAENRRPTEAKSASDAARDTVSDAEGGKTIPEEVLREAVMAKVRVTLAAAADEKIRDAFATAVGEKMRDAALDAAMKSAGFVRVQNEDGTENYCGGNKIKYIEL